jgi:hypothetical protein
MKKLFCLVLSVLILAGMLFQAVPAALAAGSDANLTAAPLTVPTVSCNAGAQNYDWYSARPVSSMLCANSDGSFTRVEAVGSKLICEVYNADGSFRSGKELPVELPLYGGAYAGTNYRFAVFGQENNAESNSAEVIRVVRYDENWNRIDSVSLRGANTVCPFDAGSLRMVQSGDMLYILTCHLMYTTSNDGLRHQANLTLAVHIPTMQITDCRSAISSWSTGYASHSFNQFILADGQDLLTLDHWEFGSGGRGAIVHCYANAAGASTLPGTAAYVNAFPFAPGSENYCGADLGGFAALNGKSYLVAGSSVPLNATNLYGQRNVFVSVVKGASPFSASSTQTLWLTNYAEGSNVSISNPQTVKLSGDQLLVLWQENDVLRWTCVNNSGTKTCPVYSGNAKLSDCQPILVDGKVIWYYTDDSMPVFCQISASNLSKLTTVDSSMVTSTPGLPFTDVPIGAWYSAPVVWALGQGITSGTSATTFSPSASCTRAQFVTFLWRAAGSPEPENTECPFEDVSPESYYCKAATWAEENGYVTGVQEGVFGADAACTRAQAMTILWRYSDSPEVSIYYFPFDDVPSDAYFYKAVRWAYKNHVTAGTSEKKFSPDNPCSRAEMVTFLYKLLAS